MQMDRRRFLSATAGACAAALLAACGRSAGTSSTDREGNGDAGQTVGSAASPVTAATIVSPDSTFDVTTVHVPVGRPVTFTYDNRDTGVPHNLHVSGNGLDSKTPVRPGAVVQTLTVTFASPGTYDYICDVHPDTMTGVVIAG